MFMLGSLQASIIIPVIRRRSAARCIAAIYQNAGIPEMDYEIITEEDTGRIGCPEMVKQLTAKTNSERVMFLGDDTIPQPDFLKNALSAMEALPDGWGMVGLNDGKLDGYQIVSHWIVDKRLLPYLGGEFFHTGYRHCQCDKELLYRCLKLGRYTWAEDAFVIHDNPLLNKEKLTGDYAQIYSKEWLAHDTALLTTRLMMLDMVS